MTSVPVSVVVPVKDGERYLEELLDALAREGGGGLEVVVVDSGSRDRSVAIARSAGALVVEIPPEQFGHGRTRNLGAERSSGSLICFLTQDATPVAGWLDAYRECFAMDARVGAAYGPHLPRPGTSPMIARELEEFFASFAPDGRPAVQRAGDTSFLSNVNACYSRTCWEQLRFPDVPYAEDQAFGRELLAAGWTKVFHPGAAVLHSHDYDAVEFMRRYFDEYRGLRATIGHVEPFGVRSAGRDVARLVAADRRWLRERGVGGRALGGWTARAALHHSGRKVFSALGSRSERIPDGVQRALSLEGQGPAPIATRDSATRLLDTAAAPSSAIPGAASPSGTAPAMIGRASALPPTRLVRGRVRRHEFEAVARVLAEGPAPLLEPLPGVAERDRLHLALLIPHYRRGSGGHNLLFQLLVRLERMGHTCSVWHVDPQGHQPEPAAVIRQGIIEHFAPIRAPVFKGFDSWYGADVAIATSWITAYYALALERCHSRVYLVNDHEPEFYPTSAESHFAAQSYGFGMPVIAGSRWLRDLMRDRYGVQATSFSYGVDHDVYRERPIERRRDTIAFYARATTPRRGVSLGLLALQIVKQRRPDLRVVLFGDSAGPPTTFDYEHLGVVSPEQLSWLYSEATVGLCLSLTNYSLIPKEMLACGLPVVDLEGASAQSMFGPNGPVELSPPNPWNLAAAIEHLLDDKPTWSHRSLQGKALVATHTWDAAANEVAKALRATLAPH